MRIIEIKLNKMQHDYLFNNVLPTIKTLSSKDIKEKKYSFVISLSSENADIIRDKCEDIQEINGFDEAYNLTKEGKLLEELIDLLFN